MHSLHRSRLCLIRAQASKTSTRVGAASPPRTRSVHGGEIRVPRRLPARTRDPSEVHPCAAALCNAAWAPRAHLHICAHRSALQTCFFRARALVRSRWASPAPRGAHCTHPGARRRSAQLAPRVLPQVHFADRRARSCPTRPPAGIFHVRALLEIPEVSPAPAADRQRSRRARQPCARAVACAVPCASVGTARPAASPDGDAGGLRPLALPRLTHGGEPRTESTL